MVAERGCALVLGAPSRAGRERSGGFFDPVSDVGNGFDCRGFSEFASESADGDVDGVGEGVNVFVPYLGEEVFGAEDGVLGAHEGFEYRELFGTEVELSSVASSGVV